MEIVTLIVGALAAGAAASLKKIGGDVIQTAYDELKAAVVARTNRKAAVEALQEDPQSIPLKQVVEAALQKSGASADADLAKLAAELNEALSRLAPQEKAATGIDLRELEARNVTLRKIVAGGSGVVGDRWKLSGDLLIEDVEAGGASQKTDRDGGRRARRLSRNPASPGWTRSDDRVRD